MYFIFSDVDGTMIDANLHLLDQTVNDIKTAQAKGITFGICTGNSHFENMSKLASLVKPRFLITSDGSRVYDFDHNKIIYKKMIPQSLANAIFKKIKPLAYYVVWTTETALYTCIQNPKYKPHALETIKKYNCQSGCSILSNQIQEPVYKISCYGSLSNLDKIEQVLQNINISFLRHNDHFLTISPPNSNKGEAIRATIEKQNARLDNVMVIGDGINDLSMLQLVPHAYAVANAIPGLKAVAKHYSSSVEQNGLGEAIVDFMFRKKL